jgi:hypothetical protein
VYLRILANQALSEFAFVTLINRSSATQVMDGSSIRFSLPTDCIRLDAVFDNDTGEEMRHGGVRQWSLAPDAEATWWVESGNLVVGYNNASGATFTALPDTYTMELRYRSYPETLTSANIDSELDLPPPFHLGIEARLRERLSAGNPDITRYWHAVYADSVRKAKMYANEQQDGGDYNIMMYDNTLR